jgi:hypothetical protein
MHVFLPVGISFIPGHIAVYQITAPAMLIAIIRDLYTDWRTTRIVKSNSPFELDPSTPRTPTQSSLHSELNPDRSPLDIALHSVNSILQRIDTINSIAAQPTFPANKLPPSIPQIFSSIFPTTTSTISRLPLSLLLFAGGIFVLSKSLTSLGWTQIFATWLARLCTTPAATV